MPPYEIKQSRYLLQGACIHDEYMKFKSMHAAEETLVLDSIRYRVKAVIVDGTTQVIDLECIQNEISTT